MTSVSQDGATADEPPEEPLAPGVVTSEGRTSSTEARSAALTRISGVRKHEQDVAQRNQGRAAELDRALYEKGKQDKEERQKRRRCCQWSLKALKGRAAYDDTKQKHQGAGEWWTKLLTSETLHPSAEHEADHAAESDGAPACRACVEGTSTERARGAHHTCKHQDVLNKLSTYIEPDKVEEGQFQWRAVKRRSVKQKGEEAAAGKAAMRLEDRDGVGATVLHACMLSYGANRERNPRLSERAVAISRYLILHYGPAQLQQNRERLGFDIDLVNRSYFGDDNGTGSDYNGETALHMAIVYQDEALVKLLLECGADLSSRAYGSFFEPSGQCYYGELPLSFAVSCGNLRIAYLLVDHVRNAPRRILQRRFREWDTDNDGLISHEEAMLGFRTYCDDEKLLRAVEQAADREAHTMDADGDLKIDFEEFAQWLHNPEDSSDYDNVLMQQDRVYRLVTQTDALGNNAVHMAVFHKQIDAFDWLLERSTCIGCHAPRREELVSIDNPLRRTYLEQQEEVMHEQELVERTMKRQEKEYCRRFDINGDGLTTSIEIMVSWS